jgi:hypothetical protein
MIQWGGLYGDGDSDHHIASDNSDIGSDVLISSDSKGSIDYDFGKDCTGVAMTPHY